MNTKNTGILLISILLITITIMPLISCANPLSESILSPEEVIAKSKAVMDGLKAYRCETSTVNIDENGNTNQSKGNMEYIVPDRSHTTSGDSESITIGNIVYQRLTTESTWSVRNFDQPFVSSQKLSIGIFYEPLVELVALRDENIDGVQCFHYKASRDMKAVAEEQLKRLNQLDPSDPKYVNLRESQEMMVQTLANTVLNVEYWIGKGDYFVRRVGFEQKMPIPEKAEKPARELSVTGTYRFYDFNADIIIEPPSNLEGVYLMSNYSSSVGGSEDPRHQRVSFTITISNLGIETAENVQVYVESQATNAGLATFNGGDGKTIPPGTSENYTVTWEANIDVMGKVAFADLMNRNTVWTTWIGSDGKENEKIFVKDGVQVGF
jgi:hypothetical protein